MIVQLVQNVIKVEITQGYVSSLVTQRVIRPSIQPPGGNVGGVSTFAALTDAPRDNVLLDAELDDVLFDATTASATDATTKANAAQAAAIAAAATDATTKANAAQAAAIAAAATDATTKANAAQAAAIAAAATDATTKANAAQAAAIAAAATDATTKANAAQAAAIAAAATDATTKANAAQTNAQAYADGLVVGLVDDRGNYNASSNVFPSTGGSGAAGAVLKGDLWTISVAGTLGGTAVTAGDTIRALVDTPGQTTGNWAQLENNFGFTPESVANKVTAISGASTDTEYPSAKLLYDKLALKDIQLGLKANLASPALTGVPTMPTAAAGTNTTQGATTAFVRGEVGLGNFPPPRIWAAGLMHYPFVGVQMASRIAFSPVQERLYYHVGFAAANIDVSNVRINVATGVASANFRVGICAWDPVNNEPGALIVDWGFGSAATSNTFISPSNAAAVASLVKGSCYALMFISGGGASAPAIYYIPVITLGVPTLNEGATIQSIMSIFDANEGAQRTGGFNSPPSAAAALTAETAVNATGGRSLAYFSTQVPR